MANQIPLIVNAGAAQIQELATTDNLVVAANVVTGGILTDGYYYANGTPVTFGGSGNVDLTQVTTDIIPTGNNTQSLGNATNQWSDLYVSNATIYMNNVPIGLTSANVLTVNGDSVVTTSGAGNTLSATDISVTGNISAAGFYTGDFPPSTPGEYYFWANSTSIQMGTSMAQGISVNSDGIDIGGTGGVNIYGINLANVNIGNPTGGFINVVTPLISTNSITATSYYGDGSNLSNLPAGTQIINGLTAVDIPAADGNATITVNDGPVWTFDTNGNLSLPAVNDVAITAPYNNLVINAANYLTIDTVGNGAIEIGLGNGVAPVLLGSSTKNVQIQSDLFKANNVSALGNVASQGIISAVGNIVTDGYFIGNFQGNITGNFVVPGGNTQVIFNTNGNADAVGGLTYNTDSNVLTVLGNISAQGTVNAGYFVGDGSGLTNLTIATSNTIANGTSNVTIPTTDGNVDVNVGEAVYSFGSTGRFTLPNNFTLDVSTGDANINTVNSLYLNAQTNVVVSSNTADWVFDTTGKLTFPSGTISTGSDILIPTSNTFAVTTASPVSVSAPCYIAVGDEFVADTEFNDDITVVQVGWTVVVDGTTYTVTYIDPAPPAHQYRITAAGATFVQTQTYTFTNPVATTHTWSIDQYGVLTAPGNGTISQINNDFFIAVSGTDIIGLRTDGGDVILDAAGNLNIPGNVVSTTSVSRLSLNENGSGGAYLTSTDNDTTALLLRTTDIQMYAGVNQTITAGVLLHGLETNYADSRQVLEDIFTQNSGEAGYPWGITLPVSYLTYNELILLAPDTFPNQTACTAQANSTTNNYELWQDTITETNVTVTANENSWVFDATGNLTIPSSSGGLIKSAANASIGITAINNGTDNPAQLMSWTIGQSNPSTIVSTYANSATIMTDVNGSIKTWSFDNGGNLTLPGNTFAVNYANGTPVSIGGGSSVAEAPFNIQALNFSATAGSRYGINTSGGSLTATLPTSPSIGDAVFFADAGGAYSSNNLIVDPDTNTIMGVSGTMTVSTDGQSFGLFWNGTTWRTYN